MKKKLTAIILASAIAVSAVGLTACGGDEDDGVLKSEKVSSATEWAAAFDFSDVTNVTVKMDGWEERVMTYSFDGDKFKSQYGDNVRYIRYDSKMYDEYHTTEYVYTYDAEAEEWSVREDGTYDKETVASYFRYFDRMTGSSGYMSERYSEFTYSDSEYAYVATYDELNDINDIKIAVKIKDGKVVYGSMTGSMNDNGTDVTTTLVIELYDFGTTKVNLPTVE